MPNLKAKIDGHSKKVLENTPPPKIKLCNCSKKENCLMRGACLTENILYYTRISCQDEIYKPKLYKGIFETTSKNRYADHEKSFNVERNKNDTKLSTEYWKLANKRLHVRISWSIKGNYKLYNSNSERCSWFLHEKLKIVHDPYEILNKRSEVISQCRHRNKCKLKTLVSNKKDRVII